MSEFLSLFFVKTLQGKTYRIFLNPREKNPRVVCKKIADQLPFPTTDAFKVLCEGKDLSLFDDFQTGIGSYLSTLNTIYVI
jgi:hypothetical protein